ncbi:hypothetical protein FLX56_14225 [Synechococcus moorigangaii CMS01]|nr:hypothetical protein [Synechococcus moorigangaii CMS01]
MVESGDRLGEHRLRQLRLYLYLLPILGFFPALWQLYWRKGDRREQKVSRQAAMLMLSWLGLYLTLSWSGDHLMGVSGFRIMFLNALLTSGYFLSCLFLMVRVWQKSN